MEKTEKRGGASAVARSEVICKYKEISRETEESENDFYAGGVPHWNKDIKTTVGVVLLSGRRFTYEELWNLTRVPKTRFLAIIECFRKEGASIETEDVRNKWGHMKRTYFLKGSFEPDNERIKGEKPFLYNDYSSIIDVAIKSRMYNQNSERVMIKWIYRINDSEWRCQLFFWLEMVWVKELEIHDNGYPVDKYFVRYCHLKLTKLTIVKKESDEND